MFATLLSSLLLLLSVAAAAYAVDERAVVGTVKSVTGSGHVVRDGQRLDLKPGFQLALGDRVVTGAEGSAGILLRDDTALSLGPATETSIDHFAFEPARGKLGMVLRVARGVFGYLSGQIAKLAPGSVRIETPVATLGVRGTHFVARIVP